MRRVLPLLGLLALGCPSAPPDPGLVAERKALDAWRSGEEHLQAGRAQQARQAFELALEHQPADPVILAWRARSEAAAGEPREAVQTLDTVLSKEPGFAEARYNRAAYLARLGDLDRAASDLRRALLDGAGDPREALLDADFQPHLSHPAFSFLPQAPLALEVKGPGGTVFVGSDATLRLSVTGLSLDGLSVQAPDIRAPVRLSRVEERVEELDGGDERITLTWTLRVLGAGRADLGPFVARSGPREASADALTLVTLAPPDAEPPPSRTVSLIRPSTLAATAPSDQAHAWVHQGRLVVRSEPSHRVQVEPDPGPVTRAVHVVDREERYVLRLYDLDDPATEAAGPDAARPTVRIRAAGQVVFEGPPTR